MVKPAAKPAAPPTAAESRTAPKAANTEPNGSPPYEEKQRLDVLLKKLDQRIYGALTDGLKIRDEDIHFLEIAHRQAGDQAWDHALIEVEVPASAEAGALVQAIQRRLAEFPADARVRAAVRDKQTVAVFVGEMHTHTLRLMPSPPAVAAYIPDTPPPRPPLPLPPVPRDRPAGSGHRHRRFRADARTGGMFSRIRIASGRFRAAASGEFPEHRPAGV